MKEVISKHQVKLTVATLITVLIFVISTTYSSATWKAQMEAEHQDIKESIVHLGERGVDQRKEIDLLKDKANERDIELAKINTKLTNIESLLLDNKQDLKEISIKLEEHNDNN